MKPSSHVRGGLALCWKPDSLRSVAISTGTGTPRLRCVCSAACFQSSNQPAFWSNTAQRSLIRLGAAERPGSAAANAATNANPAIFVKCDIRMAEV